MYAGNSYTEEENEEETEVGRGKEENRGVASSVFYLH